MPTKRLPTNSTECIRIARLRPFGFGSDRWSRILDFSLDNSNAPIRISRAPIFFVKVSGESLWPELVPGKCYLATSVLKPRAGDYLVFKNPKNLREIFVKKIKNVLDDSYEVGGTIPWSSSSEEFGLVPDELVLGKIIFLWSPRYVFASCGNKNNPA